MSGIKIKLQNKQCVKIFVEKMSQFGQISPFLESLAFLDVTEELTNIGEMTTEG